MRSLGRFFFGFASILPIGGFLWFVIPNPIAPDRVVYTLSWSALFSIPLFLGIHVTLFQRFGSEDLIKGHASSGKLGFHGAYLSNTVEQALVNVLTAISLGMVAPVEYIKVVPIQACIFIVSRVWFFVAYKKNPMYRFAGFAMGYYAAVVSLVLILFWSF
jgi:hypothetical protein